MDSFTFAYDTAVLKSSVITVPLVPSGVASNYE